MNQNRHSIDFNIKATWLAIQKMYNSLGANAHITHSNGFVLLNIDPESGTPATKIAPLMGMEARSLSRMLKTMEDENVIYRKDDNADKRKVIICLTEEGKRKREIAREVVRDFNAEIRQSIPTEQLSAFLETIRKIAEIADDYKNKKII